MDIISVNTFWTIWLLAHLILAVGLLGALTHQAVSVTMPVRKVAGPGGFVTRFRAVPAAGYATADSKAGKSVSKSAPQAL